MDRQSLHISERCSPESLPHAGTIVLFPSFVKLGLWTTPVGNPLENSRNLSLIEPESVPDTGAIILSRYPAGKRKPRTGGALLGRALSAGLPLDTPAYRDAERPAWEWGNFLRAIHAQGIGVGSRQELYRLPVDGERDLHGPPRGSTHYTAAPVSSPPSASASWPMNSRRVST